MRLGRDRLIFRALAVLDEAVDDCREEPIRPTLGQRFALMFHYAVSNGDRHAYDDFWCAVRDGGDHGQSENMARTMRATSARTCLTGIARSVGVEFSVEYQSELRVARMPPEERADMREREAELAEHRRRLREDGWQYQAEDRVKSERTAAMEIIKTEE